MSYILRISHNLDSIDSKFIDNEMNTIALTHGAVYTNYDLETEFDSKIFVSKFDRLIFLSYFQSNIKL